MLKMVDDVNAAGAQADKKQDKKKDKLMDKRLAPLQHQSAPLRNKIIMALRNANRSGCNSSLPASILEKSRMSLMR